MRFLGHARGSKRELQTQLVIAKPLGFGVERSCGKVETRYADVSRLLIALMNKLKG